MTATQTDITAAFDRKVEEIRRDTTASPEAKTQRLARAYLEATTAAREARAASATAKAETIRTLEARFMGAPAGSTSSEAVQLAASYRDALGRVGGLTSDKLRSALDQARLTGDHLMARAILTTAWQDRDTEVVDRYAATFPEHRGDLQALLAATTMTPTDRMLESMLNDSIRRPSELEHRTPGDIA